MSDQIQRAGELVDQAMAHHAKAVDAHERGGDARTVSREHAHVTRCLRSAQQCFRNIAAEAMQADSDATKTVQTSAGTKIDTGSDNGRAGSPLFRKGNAGISEWLDRARVGARR
jgi:hypothetical protein